MEFSKQKYWNGLPFPSPGDLPNPGIEPWSALQADSLLSEPPGKPTLLLIPWLSFHTCDSTSPSSQSTLPCLPGPSPPHSCFNLPQGSSLNQSLIGKTCWITNSVLLSGHHYTLTTDTNTHVDKNICVFCLPIVLNKCYHNTSAM